MPSLTLCANGLLVSVCPMVSYSNTNISTRSQECFCSCDSKPSTFTLNIKNEVFKTSAILEKYCIAQGVAV